MSQVILVCLNLFVEESKIWSKTFEIFNIVESGDSKCFKEIDVLELCE